MYFLCFRFQPELIEAYGFPSEVHHVTTDDGYVLELHRIAAPGKQPVFLMHGLLDSSATWILLGPDKGLGSLNFFQTELLVFYESKFVSVIFKTSDRLYFTQSKV